MSSSFNLTQVEGLTARQFCRIAFGYANMSVEDIVDYEAEYGYRKRCINLLFNVTGVPVRTIRSWGSGINFERMPEPYQRTLAYAVLAYKSQGTSQPRMKQAA